MVASQKEPLAAVSHELGHIKTRNTWAIEYILVVVASLAFAFFLAIITVPAFGIMTAIAFQLLIFTKVSHRNEFRADYEGAFYNGAEGLISLFELFIYESGRNEMSETHPSPNERIKRLKKFLKDKN